MAQSDLADMIKAVPQGAESAFPSVEYDSRLAALRAAMAAREIDLVIVSGPENVFYLSGQQTPGYYTFQALCIPAEDAPFIVLRGLEVMNARLNTFIDDIEGYADDVPPPVAVADVLKARGWAGKRVAIDKGAWFLTVNAYAMLEERFGPMMDASGLVESLRRVKSPREIDQLIAAAAANDKGMEAGLSATRVGASENDVAAAIMGASIAAGSEYVGMAPFVTSGPRAGVPHTTWRRRTIEAGDVVILESAAAYNRYHAALFRTVFLGDVPADARAMYEVCEEAYDAALGCMIPGKTCADVHNAAQAVIDAHGQTAGYRKRSGYSIGISFAPDWGEGNILSLFRGVDVPLEPGMAFHIPISLRAYNRFTVAVSDTVLITDGAPRPLSALPRGVHVA
ncbi:M24 family metallopeptidase [Acuticoccus kandeliae]|uniref:M24 family metallopeptidase n=1 Tax=Acuticoccus kandeliae TaxID=2073160 RepID=UPI00196A43C6|nr:Xaa-Pro peptidase family protein [Acuticoccus kandeliae]